MDISIIGYDPIGAWKKSAATVDELLEFRNPAGITWINVDGLDDAGAISGLAEFFKIHPLTVEDILSTEQRPKVEEFERYLFISIKAVTRNADGDICFDQASFVVLKDAVISFQGMPGDPFGGIRRRILDNAGRIRKMGADYLAYVLMDSIVDKYFLILEHIGTAIENFEERAADDSDTAFIPDIQKIKQQLLHVRRIVWPLRESLSLLLRLESPLLSNEIEPFFKDLHENSIQAAETIETYRELVSGIMEVNLSAVSARMNKVMKVLTIISTLFIPLTFIVGVYGMNFKFMPELEYRYAYPITWGVMLAIVVGMLVLFKRRNWF
ncbi:MAG: magnesium/cobalt transporter CorA [Treponema sp.]|jgi:magnesium transporter|nr:magnesium/cobalt transporter CorA [Treponema sp.]